MNIKRKHTILTNMDKLSGIEKREAGASVAKCTIYH
jgi:hypothetical protein